MQFPILVYNKEQFSCLLHYKLLHLSVTHLAAQHKETAQIKNAFIRGADGDLSMSETFLSQEIFFSLFFGCYWLTLSFLII